ncbi:MAG TPA: hypothetical protein VGR74_00045, partial [Actinomycetota bacterium]|nr:hypothetical protein [Actinomycetota bacterium]
GHSTYQVKVAPDGGFALQPVHPGAGRAVAPVRGAWARFATRGIGGADAPKPTTAADGSVVIRRGEVVESLRNVEEGVEQSWTFATRPAGGGDLEVRVALDGYRYAGSTAGGLHFREPDGELGLRYGVAAWVDANGARTVVQPRWDGHEIVLTVPAAAVARAAWPAVLDPTISGEIGTDALVVGAAAGSQTKASVADDGTNYFIVWEDTRDGVRQVWGARAHGTTVVDTTGIVLSDPIGAEATNPSVIWDGTHFMVVWANVQVFCRQVNSDGTLVNATPTAVTDTATVHAIGTPTVAWNGTRYLVTWSDTRLDPQGDIYGARVSSAGVAEDYATPIVISAAANGQVQPSVSSALAAGSDFLAVWTDSRSGTQAVWGARVDTNGAVLDAAGISISSGAQARSDAQVATNTNQYYVVWTDYRNATPDIYSARVNTAGAVLDAAGVAVYSGAGNQTVPVLGRSASKYLVAWRDTRNGGTDAYAARVTAGGAGVTVLDVAGVQVAAGVDSHPGGVAIHSGKFAVAHDAVSGSVRHVYYSRVDDSTGALLDATPILTSSSANAQSYPSVASDGTNFLVVWLDARNGNLDVYGTLIKPDGTLYNPGSPTITLCTNVSNQGPTQVTYNGTNFLVAWYDARLALGGGQLNIYGRRVNTAGTALDAADGFRIDDEAAGIPTNPFSIGTDGSNWLVAWGNGNDVRGAVVTSAGVVNAPVTIVSAANIQDRPKVSFTNGSYVMTWYDTQTGAAELRGGRVSTAGVLTSSAVLFSGAWLTHGIVANGSSFLLAYANSNILYGRIVDATTLVPGVEKQLATETQQVGIPALVYDGVTYVAAWTDWAAPETHGTRVSAAADPIDVPSVLIAAQTLVQNEPSKIATDGHGRSLIVYQTLDSASGTGAQRVHGKFILQLTNGQTCAAPGDCASGFCVGGICCGTACTPPHSNVTCAGGTCASTGCVAPWAACDGNAIDANGCEVNTNTANHNCGACGRSCSTTHVASRTCQAGLCTSTCSLGYGNCVKPAAPAADDGCEADTKLNGNCGACGVTCPGGACTSGICQVVAGNGSCSTIDSSACATPFCLLGGGCGLDTDNDGLSDAWENNGYVDVNCNGVNDGATVDIPLTGANMNVPDLFVRYDYMEATGVGAHTHQPPAAALTQVTQAFAAKGVTVHFVAPAASITETTVVTLDPAPTTNCAGTSYSTIQSLRLANLGNLQPAYHYLVFAHRVTTPDLAHSGSCPVDPYCSVLPDPTSTGL